MNNSDYIVLDLIVDSTDASQRELSKESSFSLGKVNKSIQKLKKRGFLDEEGKPSPKALQYISKNRPQRAVILAAGYGLRMIPLNIDTPKGLLKVESETLIERLIKQLNDVGVFEIYVVVGHLKETYEFLIDSYNVKLIVNMNYSTKNNLHSLYCALPYLENAYILPCDIWSKKNPFSQREFFSWYAVSDKNTKESGIKLIRQEQLIEVKSQEAGNAMIGISYITKDDAKWLKSSLSQLTKDSSYTHSFWEAALIEKNQFLISGKLYSSQEFFEFNSIDDYKNFSKGNDLIENEILQLISKLLGISLEEITNIQPLKSGMTNRSFTFDVSDKAYIMRIPGEGTDLLINRSQENDVHNVLLKAGLADELIYFDPVKGYKLTKKLPKARNCDPANKSEVEICVKALKNFHELALEVSHEFDLFKEIDSYEKLRGQIPSVYKDYSITKANILDLKGFVESFTIEKVLCHIDAVPDNFLFYQEDDKKVESLKIIDWEYSGMQDPHIDLAMFAIYANYSLSEVDELIDIYFDKICPEATRIKIYAYIATSGFLWSNWCEYKRLLGVDFGEYSINQYRFAKTYSKKVLSSQAYKGWKNKKENT